MTSIDDNDTTENDKTSTTTADRPAAPIQLDLRQIVRDKLGKKARWIPRCAVNALARLIHQDDLNELLRNNFPRRGADFCRGVLHDLNVSVDIVDKSKMPPKQQRRIIIVSNHPLGGLDGMALIDTFAQHFGGKVYFIVNDLLMAIEPLSDVFVPVNTHGSQSRRAICSIEEVLAGDDPVLIFPAGLCSRLQKDGKIADLKWRKTFVTMARKYNRDIFPIYFSGTNSPGFYRTARRRQRMHIRFNFEMVLLPREVFRAKGKAFSIICGDTIHIEDLKAEKPDDAARRIKDIVYRLEQKLPATSTTYEQ